MNIKLLVSTKSMCVLKQSQNHMLL